MPFPTLEVEFSYSWAESMTLLKSFDIVINSTKFDLNVIKDKEYYKNTGPE